MGNSDQLPTLVRCCGEEARASLCIPGSSGSCCTLEGLGAHIEPYVDRPHFHQQRGRTWSNVSMEGLLCFVFPLILFCFKKKKVQCSTDPKTSSCLFLPPILTFFLISPSGQDIEGAEARCSACLQDLRRQEQKDSLFTAQKVDDVPVSRSTRMHCACLFLLLQSPVFNKQTKYSRSGKGLGKIPGAAHGKDHLFATSRDLVQRTKIKPMPKGGGLSMLAPSHNPVFCFLSIAEEQGPNSVHATQSILLTICFLTTLREPF